MASDEKYVIFSTELPPQPTTTGKSYALIPRILKFYYKYSQRQHTPNPEAHCPEGRPFLRAHSFIV